MAVPPSNPVAASSPRRKKSSNTKMDRAVTQNDDVSKQTKRSKCLGVRVVGGRIYDSQNGKSCHQCRQKTMDFTAGCKNMKQDKQCTIKFCHKCLLNRYGEKAEEMAALDDWKCPKCRGICNCSLCMKKRGHKPTGILVHTAKATGFSSVSQLLDVKGPDVCQAMASPKKSASSPKSKALTEGLVVVSPKKRGKENCFDGTCNTLNSQPSISSPVESKVMKTKEEGLRRSPRKLVIPQEVTKKEKEIITDNCGIPVVDQTKDSKKQKKSKVQAEPKVKPHKLNGDMRMNDDTVDVVLPSGTLLTNVAGIDLIPEDIGHAVQFLEFCSTFGEVLGIRKGQPESVLRDMMCGRTRRKGTCSSSVQFFVQLLSFILKEEEAPPLSPTRGKDSWIHSLKKCLSESDFEVEEIPEDWFDKGCDGYEMLESSQKLRLLTFLCDEALFTEEIRNFIDDQNLKFVEKGKEAKEILHAAKEKEKLMKKKLQDKVAKAVMAKNGAPLTISEHDSIVLKIKDEAKRAHEEMLEAMDLVPKKKQRSDAVRTEPIFLDDKGRAYWRLKCFSDPHLLLQDIGAPEQIVLNEKWFRFDTEETKVIEKHISSLRLKRKWLNKLDDTTKMKGSNSDIEVVSSSGDDFSPTANDS